MQNQQNQQNDESQLLTLEKNELPKQHSKNKKLIILLAVIIISVALAIVLLKPYAAADNSLGAVNGVNTENIAMILGCNVFGLPDETAEHIVSVAAERIVESSYVKYLIEGREYSINGRQAGLVINYQKPLKAALDYSKNIEAQQESAGNFSCEIIADEAAIKSHIDKTAIPAASAVPNKWSIEKTADEEARSTSFEVVLAPAHRIEQVNIDKLAADIANSFETQKEETVTSEKVTVEQQSVAPKVQGEYQTEISRPELASAYNIWKASNILNATEISSGNTWSMRESIGGLNQEDGWLPANEWFDGSLKSTTGGGLNHLAATIFAAALSAELDIAENSHATRAPSYIDAGLDADIFSENADLKIKNNSEYNIVLAIECKAQEGTLTISILSDEGESMPIKLKTESLPAEQGGSIATVSALKQNGTEQELFSVEYAS